MKVIWRGFQRFSMLIVVLALLLLVVVVVSATPGDLDASFDSDGIVTTVINSSGSGDYGEAVAIQSDGKIVAAGYSSNGTDFDFALTRYDSDGSLDATFDADGKVTTPIGSGSDMSYGVAIQSDGKIVVAGLSRSANDDFAVVRYNSDGSQDTTFLHSFAATHPLSGGLTALTLGLLALIGAVWRLRKGPRTSARRQ